MSSKRGDKEILYSLMPNTVDWANGVSDWIDVPFFWTYVQSTWPGNGSTLFNADRGIGIDFQIDKLKFSDVSEKEQKGIRDKWNIFVCTLPSDLQESLLDKDLTSTTVRFKLLGIGGNSRKSIPAKIVRQMKTEREHKCVFCNRPGEPGKDLAMDHKDPKKAYSAIISIEDLQYACGKCNNLKRTALRKHFNGAEKLSTEKLAWYYDPKARKEANDLR